MNPTPCPICRLAVGCECSVKLGPFALYDHYQRGCGQFANIDLALNCQRLINQTSNGPSTLFTRWGLPIVLSTPDEKTNLP